MTARDPVVSISDQGVELTGIEAKDGGKKEAGSLFATVFEPKLARDAKINLRSARTKSPWIVAESKSGKIVVSGKVATEQDKQKVLASLKPVSGELDSTNLKSANDVKTGGWVSNSGNYIKELVSTADQARMEIRDNKATVSGALKDEAERNHLSRSFDQLIGNGYDVQKNLTIAPKPAMGDLPELSVYFDKNSSFMRGTQKSDLIKFAGGLKDLGNKRLNIMITGHADWRGDQRYNLWLSERRAERVLQALVRNGVNGNFSKEVKAMGEKEASSKNAGASRWAKDRRVDIRVTSP